MLFNHDLCDVISDVELPCYTKCYDWPEVVHTFDHMMTPKWESNISAIIKMDAELGTPEVALWAANNIPSIDPHTYVSDLTLPLLYNNGFITNVDSSRAMIDSAINRKKPSIDTLAIIIKCNPDRAAFIRDRAILYNKPEVINWLYKANPHGI